MRVTMIECICNIYYYYIISYIIIIIRMKKILISCDPNGRFDLLLPKIIELNNKNKFDFMLLAGKVCPIASSKIFKDITDGKYSFPIKTYFIDNSDMSFVFGGAYPHGG
mgnify:FL=1